MLVPDFTRPIPVPTNESGKMTGIDDTRATGPKAKLALKLIIPTSGFILVYSSKKRDAKKVKALPNIIQVRLPYLSTKNPKKGIMKIGST